MLRGTSVAHQLAVTATNQNAVDLFRHAYWMATCLHHITIHRDCTTYCVQTSRGHGKLGR